jgi:hypothetical protein
MEAVAAGVLVALVAGLFGLGGALISSRHQHQGWLREQRLEAYTRYLEAVGALDRWGSHSFLLRSVAERGLDSGPEDGDRYLVELPILMAELDRRLAGVLMTGPSALADPAQQLRTATMDYALNRDKESDPGRVMQEAIDDFVAAARGTLESHRRVKAS